LREGRVFEFDGGGEDYPPIQKERKNWFWGGGSCWDGRLREVATKGRGQYPLSSRGILGGRRGTRQTFKLGEKNGSGARMTRERGLPCSGRDGSLGERRNDEGGTYGFHKKKR